jgi:hypothetical protein
LQLGNFLPTDLKYSFSEYFVFDPVVRQMNIGKPYALIVNCLKGTSKTGLSYKPLPGKTIPLTPCRASFPGMPIEVANH